MINQLSTNCSGGQSTVTVTQGRYLIDADSTTAQLWHVPVVVGALSAPSVTGVVAGPHPQSIRLPGCGPVILNAGQGAYFRSRYPSAGLAAISAHFSELSAEDQLGLPNDSRSLSYNGQTSMGSFLNLASSVPADAAPEVLEALTEALRNLDRLYTELPAQQAFRRYARSILDPMLKRVGWQKLEGEPDNVAILRATLLGTLGQMDELAVVSEAQRRFELYRADAASQNAAGRKSTLEIVAQHADETTWNQLHQMAVGAATELERRELYGLLGAPRDPALVQLALDLAISGEPPATTVPEILLHAAVLHPRLTLEFTIAHWDRISPMLEPIVGARLVPRLLGAAWDPVLIDELNRFAETQIPKNARPELRKVASGVRRLNNIRKLQLPDADSWIRQRLSTAMKVSSSSVYNKPGRRAFVRATYSW